jgi:hypothetical protein
MANLGPRGKGGPLMKKLVTFASLLFLFAWLPTLSAQSTAEAKPKSPPSYCNPCLFYGGDLGSGGNGVANEMTVVVPLSQVLVPFDIPTGQIWQIGGLFTNNLSASVIDPKLATWSVSKGVQSGDCGTVLASGNSAATYKPTGRSGFGLDEYTLLVKIPPLELSSGTYWLSVIPECLNSNDNVCTTAQYYASSFQGMGFNSYGPPEPANESFVNSSYFNLDCQLASGLEFSAGVLGASDTP